MKPQFIYQNQISSLVPFFMESILISFNLHYRICMWTILHIYFLDLFLMGLWPMDIYKIFMFIETFMGNKGKMKKIKMI